MGSTRLPGKVLKDLGGRTVLDRVVSRAQRAVLLNALVVATSTQKVDDAIAAECERMEVRCFRGNETDVLDRYYHAAQAFSADAIVRITADCPLIDPELVDDTIRSFLEQKPDYATNSLITTYPRGLDVEVFTSEALASAWNSAQRPHQRAHVTPYFYENAGMFRIVSLRADGGYGHYRWTLDTPEDLEMIRSVYKHFSPRGDFGWREVLSLLEQRSDLVAINSHIRQKALSEG